MAQKKVAIIGAGIGGLSSAIRLAVLGCDVHVYEANEKAGGKAGEVITNGFRFDTGPSLLTMPFVLEELFEFAGERISDYISILKLDILCKYFYPDGTIINAYSDTKKFAEELESKTLDKKENVEKYLEYSKKIYDLTSDLFLNKSFSEFSTFANMSALKTLLQLNKLDTNRTMHEANESFFSDPKTIQLFDRYATYNGSNPYEAPATLNIIQHVEYNLGGYLVNGGLYEIPKALKKLADNKGVKFHFNNNIKKIVIENKNIKGIDTGNGVFDFDLIVSNADVNYTYNVLLEDTKSKTSKKYEKLEKSSSAIVFYWGIRGNYDSLETHNILFTNDYKSEFDDLFVNKIVADDPTVYIYISSKFNNTDAPAGCENWFVMINAPNGSDGNELDMINKARNAIISKINSILKTDIEKQILFEEILTPGKIERETKSTGGSIYGISSNNKMAAFRRQQNRSKEYNGLYFCGGSAHPGGGIPLVMLSGKITADLIKKYELN